VDSEREYSPGDLAPETGTYELLSVVGTPIGICEDFRAGMALPPAPRAFTWRLRRERRSTIND
jgi:hypothetical protein